MDTDRSYIYQLELKSSQKNDVRVMAEELLVSNSTVLDVGCACGDFGVYAVKQKKYQMYGLEYDIQSIKAAQKTGAYNEVKQVDLNRFDLNTFCDYEKKFDSILLLDILEHLNAPETVLPMFKSLLSPGGGW